jgi:hypothetical protein
MATLQTVNRPSLNNARIIISGSMQKSTPRGHKLIKNRHENKKKRGWCSTFLPRTSPPEIRLSTNFLAAYRLADIRHAPAQLTGSKKKGILAAYGRKEIEHA